MSALLPFKLRADQLLRFKVAAAAFGIELPTAATRGLELVEVANMHVNAPRGGLLAMNDDEARARVTDLSIRNHEGWGGATRGMAAGADEFSEQVLAEVRDALLPDLDGMVEQLRPMFEKTVKPFTEAAQKYGLSWETTSDQVIDRADEKVSKAWRDARDAWAAVRPIARFRTLMSEVFNVSPTPLEAERGSGGFAIRYDHSVSFAAASNWGYDGEYYVDGDQAGDINWLSMAIDGLTLNTPTQARRKILERRGFDANEIARIEAGADERFLSLDDDDTAGDVFPA